MNEFKKDVLSLLLRFGAIYRNGKNYEGTDMTLLNRKQLDKLYVDYIQIIQKHDLITKEISFYENP